MPKSSVHQVPVSSLPGSLPSINMPLDTDPKLVASSIPLNLEGLNESNLAQEALWRDSFALTGTLRTLYSPACIIPVWREVCNRRSPTSFELKIQSANIVRIGELASWVDAPFTFKTASTPRTTCSGIFSLVPASSGTWKIWVIRTILEQLDGENDVDKLRACEQPFNRTMSTLNANCTANGEDNPSSFDVVIVGGGQAGLSVAGRMKALDISYVVMEKNQEVGDNWKLRYGSARLHTIRQYSHLPFNRTFPSHYQEWLTKDDLAQGYKDWVKTYNINIWLSTRLLCGKWDHTSRRWTLQVQRDGSHHEISSSYVILAVGAGGQIAVMPDYPDRDHFKGTVLHSAEYTDPSSFKEKNGIVVGTANTAHDVAEDMLVAGLASVTMVQRSPTYVLPYEYYQRVQELLYNENVSTDYADRMSFSNPLSISRLLALTCLHAAAREEPERFDALEASGFKLERYGDITHYIYERMGGHYMDVGASKKIADGLIKIKTDALPVRYTPNGLKFEDGEELPADLIVFATGFERSMTRVVRQFFGEDVAQQVNDFWGVDEEGELIGAFKPNGHPGLWYHGGTLGHARYCSRFIALSIRAMLNESPIPVYGRNGYDDPFNV
ncbi:FAD/NAD(P)-binding domain-containing protein [Lindgomyces ingoldianus]|uniref:FAD/NAD(P)-binding domain-containing protein n=1 Tax=Lindgomyces ingoldianus TaxID=673940 RepID=A0ACB6QCY2_9PLEO|nr:FAD/NAD(P)-binding domain-containing protein [Lindgomyces ingoldianus]KAF2464232.1 FAD/NAD(P)-binding domain-containing protein [Lindgomyces ingoldianus]